MPSAIQDKIIACLTRAAERDKEKGGDGSRSARDIAEWIGDVTVSQVSNALRKLENEEKVDNLGKVEGFGNAVFWSLPVPAQKNTLVVIGYMGVKRAYLNLTEEEALRRHLEAEWPEGWDAGTEADTRSRMTSFEFTDTFLVYDAASID